MGRRAKRGENVRPWKQTGWKVYILRTPDGKSYVGATCQTLPQRWKRGKGYQPHLPMGQAIAKYGWDNIDKEVAASGLSEVEAHALEQKLIEELKTTDPEYGYNLTSGGRGSVGYHISDEAKEKLRDARSQFPVCQFDLDMNMIAEYRSVGEASRVTGAGAKEIFGCCRQEHGKITAYGSIWVLKEDVPTMDKEALLKRLEHDRAPKKVCQYTLDGKLVATFPSIGKAGRSVGVTGAEITTAIQRQKGKNGKRGYGTCKGYIWLLEGDKFVPLQDPRIKRIGKYTQCDELVKIFNSITDASKEVGVTVQAISYALRHSSTCAGYKWKYENRG